VVFIFIGILERRQQHIHFLLSTFTPALLANFHSSFAGRDCDDLPLAELKDESERDKVKFKVTCKTCFSYRYLSFQASELFRLIVSDLLKIKCYKLLKGF